MSASAPPKTEENSLKYPRFLAHSSRRVRRRGVQAAQTPNIHGIRFRFLRRTPISKDESSVAIPTLGNGLATDSGEMMGAFPTISPTRFVL
jgi:hypothetical protein